MRISIAGLLLLLIAYTWTACVHETTVFHSLDGTNYFRGSTAAVAPTDAPAPSPSLAGEPLPSR